MKSNIMTMLNRLEGYKTNIKNLHWSADDMEEHKQLDELADIVSKYEDKLAEVAMGVYGKIKFGELKPIGSQNSEPGTLINDILDEVDRFLDTIESKKDVGIRSETESFKADMEQQNTLFNFYIKEETIRRIVKDAIMEEIGR